MKNYRIASEIITEFTPEEISVIDKNLGFIVFDWAKHLINHILSQARKKGISVVYMNSSDTLYGGVNESKLQYFYERLPQQLGFKEENIALRGKGKERLWAYYFETIETSGYNSSDFFLKLAQSVPIDKIPSKYQGAFISIIGRKPSYTNDEIQKVISIVDKEAGRQRGKKSLSKYYYDWESTEWTGDQRFSDNVTEIVVKQGIPKEAQNFILENPVLTKFWSFLLSQYQHFGSDVIGFALVSPISKNIWVINEIQTDAISAYMEIRAKYYKDRDISKKEYTWETIKDMLVAKGRSNWIPILEMNPTAQNEIIQNPNIIDQLPDDSQDIQKYIEEQKIMMEEQGVTTGFDLMRHFNSVNFNSRIFRIY